MQIYNFIFNSYTKTPTYFRNKDHKEKNGVQHTLYAILPQAQHKTAHSYIVMVHAVKRAFARFRHVYTL